MGQIKNIKLHIVTDIKRTRKTSQDEARIVQLQRLQNLPWSWKKVHQNRREIVQLLEQEERTFVPHEAKSSKNLVDRVVPKETQERYPGRNHEKANPANGEIPTGHPGRLPRGHLGQTEHEAGSARSSTRSSDQGGQRQSQVGQVGEEVCGDQEECRWGEEGSAKGFQ